MSDSIVINRTDTSYKTYDYPSSIVTLSDSVFVVEMLRWGDRENHSYVIGVFTTREQAELAGDAEVSWRGNKYEYCISEYKLNFIPQDKLDNHAGCK
jgi:hypothetical protein